MLGFPTTVCSLIRLFMKFAMKMPIRTFSLLVCSFAREVFILGFDLQNIKGCEASLQSLQCSATQLLTHSHLYHEMCTSLSNHMSIVFSSLVLFSIIACRQGGRVVM